MTNKFTLGRVFRDGQTKIVIPNLKITAIDAITNIASSFVTSPQLTHFGGWFSKGGNTNPFKESIGNHIKQLVETVVDLLTIGLGVTKIETTQEYTMPFSKGIGSTGEVIHLLGARNEMINLQFTTDRYPGRMGYILRGILQKTLETAQVIYLIDDLFLATPCLIKKTRISKQADYRGAIMGSLELVSLTTGGNFMNKKTFGESKNSLRGSVSSLKESAKSSFASLGDLQSVTAVGIGILAVTWGLVNGVVTT